MEIEKLTQDLIGKEISCIINGIEIKSAKINFQNQSYYICQNKKDGSRCKNTLGYKYSWWISDDINHLNDDVTNIQLINNESNYDIY